MRTFIICTTLMLISGSVPAREDWTPPLPPGPPPGADTGGQCREREIVSEPIVSYRISPTCEVTGVRTVGEYKYGTQQLKSEVRDFASTEMVNRFISGQSQYRKERRIELHKALEQTSTLVCEMDMMERKVFEASIITPRRLANGRTIEDEETVPVENNRLAGLGVFTHSRQFSYQTDQCPDD